MSDLTEPEIKIIELMRSDKHFQRLVLELAVEIKIYELTAEREALREVLNDK